MKAAIERLRAVLPDLRAEVQDLRSDGEIATARILFTGANTGGWPGVGPNGAKVAFLAIDMHRIAGGRIRESWHLEDNLALLIQLGVVTLP